MSRWIFLALVLAICGNLVGCAAEREDTELDRLWRGGYGYNNPNPDRAKKGLAPLNFDGSTSR